MPRALPTLILLVSVTLPASAQTQIDWHTVDGGGGESAAGHYRLRGTIGQLDADEVSLCSPDGGSDCVKPRFEVTGGYWTGPAAVTSTPDDIFHDGFER